MPRYFPSTMNLRKGFSGIRSSKLPPMKPITAPGMFQRATGKSYAPQAMAKAVKALAAHPERARTAQERSFLRDVKDRSKLKETQVKTDAKGMYQLAQEEGLKLKYAAGTITEKAGQFAKQEIKSHTPPPEPHRQSEPRPIDAIRAAAHARYGSTGSGAPTVPSMQEPTPLTSAPKTPHLSPLMGGFTHGLTSHVPSQGTSSLHAVLAAELTPVPHHQKSDSTAPEPAVNNDQQVGAEDVVADPTPPPPPPTESNVAVSTNSVEH